MGLFGRNKREAAHDDDENSDVDHDGGGGGDDEPSSQPDYGYENHHHAPDEDDSLVSLSYHSDEDDDEDSDTTMNEYIRGGGGGGGDDAASRAESKAMTMSDDEMLLDEAENLKQESMDDFKRVQRWRFAVLCMLVVAGATMSTLSYFLLVNEENDDFRTAYYNYAESMKDVFLASMTNVDYAIRGLSETITTRAITTNSTFPFVTLPMFEVQGEQYRRQSSIEAFLFTPLVVSQLKNEWERYAWDNQGWLEWGRDFNLLNEEISIRKPYLPGTINSFVYEYNADYTEKLNDYSPLLAPIWMTSPPPFHPDYVNYNMFAEPVFEPILASLEEEMNGPAIIELNDESTTTTTTSEYPSTFTPVFDLTHLSIGRLDNHYDAHQPYSANSTDNNMTETNNNATGFEHPHSLVIRPVYKKIHDMSSDMVGLVQAVMGWDVYLKDLLASDVITPLQSFYGVLRNSCGQAYTYSLDGHSATYLGPGSLQEEKWNDMEVPIPIGNGAAGSESNGHCAYTFSIYPSSNLRNQWDSKLPWVVPWCVAGTFLLLAVTFFMYDRFVRRRNEKMVNTAARSTKLVSSLFPSTVRDRLLAEQDQAEQGTKSRLKNFLAGDTTDDADMEETDDLMYKTKPIADLFPETTILFGDIAGFTAWSSAREPSQVFTLLETVYRAFDMTAKRRRIFKVETVGDCYVAAAGLPEPRKDHAVAMARFAQDCMLKMQALTRKLEVSLGPDTADLTMRMGMHSGPVTAGVLRGERSRFQLFGDTMNTASRMESTGQRDRIQLSQETADLLAAAGKTRWIYPREDVVVAKGKGEMNTYWLDIDPNDLGMGLASSHTSTYFDETDGDSSSSDGSFGSETSSYEDGQMSTQPAVSAKLSRLIDWNVDVLLRLLKAIVARRRALGNTRGSSMPNEDFSRLENVTVLDEVQEIITLPAYDQATAKTQVDPASIELDAATESQLYEYVSAIASMYRDNPFHNFEHASHVTMSVVKLLSRIVAPSDLDFESSAARNQSLHDHTYGITSDPLTQFACVLSALIHDVDHTGVPNTQLVKENPEFAKMYKDRSVAEQNSVDVAWDLLFDDCYADLRATIYTTDDELQRFRQLVVNSVMATDIMDKDLKNLRNGRWEKAFAERPLHESLETTVNRKATIVIEHLIQASDIAHTMQHWHIYRKWNTRLFEEMHKAYREGRSEKNPADFWYQGEIGFFDFYIIPLAKKLKECGVFGVSSDEYLNYAERNRQEWELRGKEVVGELVEAIAAKDLNRSFNKSNSIRSMNRSNSNRSVLSRSQSKKNLLHV